jgi:hypothetical protein
MNLEQMAELKNTHVRLIKIAQAWASKKEYDPSQARSLRKQAALLLHDHYRENIPVYRRLAEEEGIGGLKDIEPIKSELMSTDDVFKSYNQEWLDLRDFQKMNEWLGTVFHQRVEINVDEVGTIDQWIDRLTENGIIPAYSSGTTGRFSFVPRDEMSWYLFTTAPMAYLTPMLMDKGFGALWQRLLVKPAIRALPPYKFAELVKKMSVTDCDGFLLNFKSGNMGIQLVGQEFAKMFKRSTFLYDIDLSASAIRCLTRGAKTEDDQKMLMEFQAGTVGNKDENYSKIIKGVKNTTRERRKIFLFGAPYQLKELTDLMAANNDRVRARDGSFILFGGGWKTFEGDKIERDDLVARVSETFGVPGDLVVEGYSMTEINSLMVRCEHGRFHMPPIIEPVILDEDLVPLEGNDLKGAFGFLDPFALSYPGFTISGDNVHLVDERCPCGMHGPALTEIGRAPGREVKGCGGIMASVQA